MKTLPRFHCPALGVLFALWLGVHGPAFAKRKIGYVRSDSRVTGPREHAKTAPPKKAPVRSKTAPEPIAPRAIVLLPRKVLSSAVDQPWLRAKPSPAPRPETERSVDPREPLPEYRDRTATTSQCRDTTPNQCSSQASELRARSRRYGKLANPASIGMSLPVLPDDLPGAQRGPDRSAVHLAVAPSAVGVKWRLKW